MPNVYKRVLGSRTYNNYTKDRLNERLTANRSKRMTQREASKAYKIPRRTLCYKLAEKHELCIGRLRAFSDEEESNFIENIIVVSDFGFPIDTTDLRYIIKSYLDRIGRRLKIFSNNLPGISWVEGFLKRNKKLSVRLASNIKRAKAPVDEKVLTEYIKKI